MKARKNDVALRGFSYVLVDLRFGATLGRLSREAVAGLIRREADAARACGLEPGEFLVVCEQTGRELNV